MIRIFNIVLITIVFIIGLCISKAIGLITLGWLWCILIPIGIADLSIFIWVIIEWIRFNPNENVTKEE